MDYKTFDSRETARAEARAMRTTGWPSARVVDVIVGSVARPPSEDERLWIVQATVEGSPKFLRSDGHVR